MSFDEVFIHNDVDTCYNLFISKITNAFDNCFKVVRLSRSKAKDKAWITPGIKNSIRTKNNLYKKWKSSGKDSDETLFKKYRREYEKIAYKAEQKFYHDKFNTKCKILNNYGAILIIFFHSLNQKIIHLFLNLQ